MQVAIFRSRWMRRVVMALALIVVTALLFVVGRWYVATQRVQDVATHAAQSIAPGDSKSTASTVRRAFSSSQAQADRGGYRLPESAGRATIHLHAIEAYASRQERDLAALPPPNLPLTAERFAQLKGLSDDGNARAACVLAEEVTKCGFLPSMGEKELQYRERKLQALQREGRTDDRLVKQIAGSRAMLKLLQEECVASVAVASAEPAWRHMLRSALLGFEPAMSRFVSSPMFDPTDLSASVDALAAYRSYYGPMLDAVAQRGDSFRMAVAAREYGGTPLRFNVFDVSVLIGGVSRDVARALAFAYATVELHSRQIAAGTSLSEKEREQAARQLASGRSRAAEIEAQSTPDERLQARALADQMIANWSPDVVSPRPKATRETPGKSKFDDFDSICRD